MSIFFNYFFYHVLVGIDPPPPLCFYKSLLSLWMPLAVKECSTFSSTQCARRAVAPRCSAGQLITQVWDLVTGHHHPALCCCQEPFTPSSSLPNGTSESIKTIITANPTQSREIIFACRSKHGRGVWVCLSGDLLDMHSAGPAITIWILRICLVWMNGLLRLSFSPRSHKAQPSRWTFFFFFLVWLETEIYDCRCWMECRPLSTAMFSLPPRLNEPLSTSTQYLLSVDLHCVSRRSIVGQCCLWEAFSALLQHS